MTIHYVQCSFCQAIGTRTPIPVTCSECGSRYIPANPVYSCRHCNGPMQIVRPSDYDWKYTEGKVKRDA